MRLTIKDNSNVKRITEDLKKIGKSNINIGVFGSDDAELTMIARVHEYGVEIPVTDKMRGWFAYQGYPLKKSTKVIKIPERSFLRSGFDENINEITKLIEAMMPRLLEDNINPDAFMEGVGLQFSSMIADKLTDLRKPANSSMTKEQKGSNNPLIDTGRLVGSIRHKIE